MVGTIYISMYFCLFYTFHYFLGYEEIIDAPAYITVACVCEEVPIAICLFAGRGEVPERIYISGVDNFVEPGSFLGQEAGITSIFLGPG